MNEKSHFLFAQMELGIFGPSKVVEFWVAWVGMLKSLELGFNFVVIEGNLQKLHIPCQ